MPSAATSLWHHRTVRSSTSVCRSRHDRLVRRRQQPARRGRRPAVETHTQDKHGAGVTAAPPSSASADRLTNTANRAARMAQRHTNDRDRRSRSVPRIRVSELAPQSNGANLDASPALANSPPPLTGPLVCLGSMRSAKAQGRRDRSSLDLQPRGEQ